MSRAADLTLLTAAAANPARPAQIKTADGAAS